MVEEFENGVMIVGNHPRDASVSRIPEVILPERQLDSRPLERMRERVNLRFKRRRRDDRRESPRHRLSNYLNFRRPSAP